MRRLTLVKVERSSYFQILSEEWRWDLFSETRFEDNLFIPFVKYPHLGNRQALAVQLFTGAWLEGGWPSHGHAISHFLSASTTLWCWQEVSNLANQRVYQILVYRHALFIINFTGVPSPSSPVSPHFSPLFCSLYFSLALHCLNAWNRLLVTLNAFPHSPLFLTAERTNIYFHFFLGLVLSST